MATTTTIIKTQIQFRRATTAEWDQYKSVVPAAGEPCFDTELGTLKIGDGVKTYGELVAIGSNGNASIAADGKSIILENDVFKLVGFDTAETGAQPRKNADGNIEWVVPAAENTEELQSRVETLENKIDVLNGDENTEGSVLKIVKDEINTFATNISDDEKVNTFKELVDYVANHGGEATTLAADISALQELVGETPVSEQIENAIAGIETGENGGKIDVIKLGDNPLEITDKTVTIPVGAGLTASEEVTISEGGVLGVGTIRVSKLVNDEESILVLDGGKAN